MKEVKNKKYYISCPKGLEETLKTELESLEIPEPEVTGGGVQFFGTKFDALKVIIHSRVASRVYQKIESYRIHNEKDLYNKAKDVWWDKYFSVDQTFKITCKLTKSDSGKRMSKFKSNIYISQVLKDSIVDYFRDKMKKRPSVDKDNPTVPFMIHVWPADKDKVRDEFCDIYIDLSGAPLSNRGYRKKGHEAPLRENLAAGMLLNIPELKEREHYTDLMCGSGTSLIEAAFIKYDVPPSWVHIKSFIEKNWELPWTFLKQDFYTKDDQLQKDFSKLMAEAMKQGQAGTDKLRVTGKMYGYDINLINIKTSHININRSYLKGCIELKEADALTVTDNHQGIVFANPPYGERMGEKNEEMEKLYYKLGENLKANFKGSIFYMITNSQDLIKKISLQTSRKMQVWNGSLECRFVRYELF